MPIMDSQLLFGESIDIGSTSASTNAYSTNNVIIPQVTDHIGTSRNDRVNLSGKLYWNATVENEAVAGSGGTSSLTVALYNHTAAIAGGTIASADLVDSVVISADASGSNYPDGTQILSRAIPQGTYKEYWAVVFTPATKKIATGQITSWIGNAIQQGGEHGAL